MIITVKKSATEKELDRLEKDLRGKGLQIHKSIGDEINVWGLVGTAFCCECNACICTI